MKAKDIDIYRAVAEYEELIYLIDSGDSDNELQERMRELINMSDSIASFMDQRRKCADDAVAVLSMAIDKVEKLTSTLSDDEIILELGIHPQMLDAITTELGVDISFCGGGYLDLDGSQDRNIVESVLEQAIRDLEANSTRDEDGANYIRSL